MSKCSHCGAEPREPDDTDARALWKEAGKHWPGGATTWNESVYKPQYRALAAWCRRYFGGTQVDSDAGPKVLQAAWRKATWGTAPDSSAWDNQSEECKLGYRAEWAAARAYFQAHPEELQSG